MLNKIHNNPEALPVKKNKKSWLLRFVLFCCKIVLLVILPFLILIRGAVFLNLHYGLSAWASLLISLLLSSVLCMLYLFFFYKLIFRKRIGWKGLRCMWISSLLLLVFYCTYAVSYFSDHNAKSTTVASEYHSLHPLLRISIATLLIVDSDALMTDFSRTHADYKAMGKQSLVNSLHYVQEDSYVHAVDIRTNGRGEIRNNLLRVYFYVMGLNSLRHYGTADHLHISLSVKSKPGVI